jgi:predicted AAA+ superfamily ATPase
MVKEALKLIITENQERMPFTLFPRHAETLLTTRQIHAVIGLRRAGKTHFLYQMINELLADGVQKEAILLVSFEDERLAGLTAERLGLVLEAYYELFPERVREEVHLLLDEVQAVPGWEKFVTRLFEEKRYRLRITGSSSKLLSKEIATSLRGRAITTHLYPLSFREFAEHRGVAITGTLAYSRERFKAAKLLDEYLAWGGFFEVVDAKDDAERRRIVSSYLDLVVYKDLVERYGVKNLALMKALIRYFVTNTTRKASLARLHRDFSATMKAARNTVAQYASFLEDASFLYEVRKFSHSARGQNTLSKYYVADSSFKTVAGLNFSADRGLLYENAVLLDLLRRDGEPFFFEETGECDFVVKVGTGVTTAIQVCVDPAPARERELRGLLAAMTTFSLNEGTIITQEHDDEETVDGKRVRFLPLWRWLLEE